MRKQIVNTFEKGLNTDNYKLNSDPATLTDAKNASINTDFNEKLIVQSSEGVEALPDDAQITTGFKPVAAKELEGISYIISTSESSSFKVTEEHSIDPIDYVASNSFTKVADKYNADLTINNLSTDTPKAGTKGNGQIIFNALPEAHGVITSFSKLDLSGKINTINPYRGKDRWYVLENTVPAYLMPAAGQHIVVEFYRNDILTDTISSITIRGANDIEARTNLFIDLNAILSTGTWTNTLMKYVLADYSDTTDWRFYIKNNTPKSDRDSFISSKFAVKMHVPAGSVSGLSTDWEFFSDSKILEPYDVCSGDKVSLEFYGEKVTVEVLENQTDDIETLLAKEVDKLFAYSNNGKVIENKYENIDGKLVTLTTENLTGYPKHNSYSMDNQYFSGFNATIDNPTISIKLDNITLIRIKYYLNDTLESVTDKAFKRLKENTFGTIISSVIRSASNSIDLVGIDDEKANTSILSIELSTGGIFNPLQIGTGKWLNNNPPTITQIRGAVNGIKMPYIHLYINSILIISNQQEVGDTIDSFLNNLINKYKQSSFYINYKYDIIKSGNKITISTKNLLGQVEIGTYPGFIGNSKSEEVKLVNEYKPLKNFYDLGDSDDSGLNDDSNYNSPFRTNKLLLGNNVDLTLQHSYDNSVNLIFTDGLNVPRIVNSRFKPKNNGYVIADRTQTKDENTYSNQNIDKTKLIQASYSDIPKLELVEIGTDGDLPIGNYRFYFKYQDNDGNLSDIIEESRLVSIFHGNTPFTANAGIPGDKASKSVNFKLSNLKSGFSKIKVYYSFTTGTADSTVIIKEIPSAYNIINESVIINVRNTDTHLSIDPSELQATYNSIHSVKTLTQSANRLVLANTSSEIQFYDELKTFSKLISCEAITTDDITFPKGFDDNVNVGYSDPINIYNHLSYWSGETYEFGIVYITKYGNTPVFPIEGKDDFSGVSTFSNSKGIYRTEKNKFLVNNIPKVIKMKFTLPSGIDRFIDIYGFFFVRKQRVKDAQYQGILCNCYSALAKKILKKEIYKVSVGKLAGLGSNETTKKVVWAPCPGNIIEYVKSDNAGSFISLTNPNFEQNRKAFYSGDVIDNQIKSLAYFTSPKRFVSLDKVCKANMDSGSIDFKYRYFTAPIIQDKEGPKVTADPYYIPAEDETYGEDSFSSLINRNLMVEYTSDWDAALTANPTGIKDFDVTDWDDVLSVYAKYNSYVGLKITDQNKVDNINLDTFDDPTKYTMQWSNTTSTNKSVNIGHLCNVYNNSYTERDLTKFSNDSDSEYFAISSRYGIDNYKSGGTVIASDGDNFINLNYQRVFYKAGDPKVSDISTLDKELQTGYNDLGTVICWYSENNTNTNLRTLEFDASDQVLYGDKRKYYPLLSQEKIKTSSQKDTTLAAESLSSANKINSYFGLDETAPIYTFNYPNRVYVSNKNDNTEFINSYRIFSGINYRDYDSSYGYIVKLITFNNYVYIICRNGIQMIEVSEQSLLGNDENIRISAAQVLPEKAQIVSNFYGIDSISAAEKTNFAIYGVDKLSNSVWMIRDGQFKLISEGLVQKKLNLFRDYFNNEYKVKVVSDRSDNKVYFTYTNYLETEAKTLIFNEQLGLWVSETDMHPFFISGSIYNKVLLETVLPRNIIYKIVGNHPCFYRNTQKTFELEFIINQEVSIQKVLTNFQVVSDLVAPDKIIYTTSEDNDATTRSEKIITQTVLVREEPHSSYYTMESKINDHEIIISSDKGNVNDDAVYFRQKEYLYAPKPGQSSNNVSSHKINNVIIQGNKLKLTLASDINFKVGEPVVLGRYIPLRRATADIINDSVKIVCKRDQDPNADQPKYSRRIDGYNRDIRGNIVRVRFIYSGTKQVAIQRIISIINS